MREPVARGPLGDFQEFRVSGKSDAFDWTAGLFYLHIDTHSINGIKFPVGSVVLRDVLRPALTGGGSRLAVGLGF